MYTGYLTIIRLCIQIALFSTYVSKTCYHIYIHTTAYAMITWPIFGMTAIPFGSPWPGNRVALGTALAARPVSRRGARLGRPKGGLHLSKRVEMDLTWAAVENAVWILVQIVIVTCQSTVSTFASCTLSNTLETLTSKGIQQDTRSYSTMCLWVSWAYAEWWAVCQAINLEAVDGFPCPVTVRKQGKGHGHTAALFMPTYCQTSPTQKHTVFGVVSGSAAEFCAHDEWDLMIILTFNLEYGTHPWRLP